MIDNVINYSLEKHKPIDIIYMKGMDITQRRIKVFKIDNNIIKAIDLEKGAIRNFKKDSILSAMQVKFFNYSDISTRNIKRRNLQLESHN
ncbi:hypothetical protein SAMN05660462_00862 [Proteiniborus ethanoligenes]|uniref:WYL domain-containing protein n=1 Tax=Proteiniborus ethanoligenes TaxID=415015 RepID=A0A1H3MMJ9_9FIRM|nr:hypothetical protein [Proteiniborus ethanoligenes]TAH63915.1 MAG: hypothetical protein EWM50_00950 [Gottschalkiaceae bacterium]SDY77405.1 hypothetical protein SAMN05660462_00862 [Proteiniborus ethanoligenes]